MKRQKEEGAVGENKRVIELIFHEAVRESNELFVDNGCCPRCQSLGLIVADARLIWIH